MFDLSVTPQKKVGHLLEWRRMPFQIHAYCGPKCFPFELFRSSQWASLPCFHSLLSPGLNGKSYQWLHSSHLLHCSIAFCACIHWFVDLRSKRLDLGLWASTLWAWRWGSAQRCQMETSKLASVQHKQAVSRKLRLSEIVCACVCIYEHVMWYISVNMYIYI